MHFFEFEKEMANTPIFTSNELKTIFYNQKNILVQVAFWIKKGYIKKIEKGVYLLAIEEHNIDPMSLAGKIYKPSYLSLEFALNHYGIIPDIPGTYTSVSSRKTKFFKNEFGNFSYQKVKEGLFTGYKTVSSGKVSFNVATPEKAIMDFIYFNKNKFIPEFNYWQELRIDEDFKFNKKIINSYKKLFRDKKVNILIDSLLNYQKNAR